MSDRKRCPDWRGVLLSLPTGAGVVLRDYDAPDRKQMAAEMAELCGRRGLVLIIGGDPDLALAFSAGLHMPEKMAPTLRRHLARMPKGGRRLPNRPVTLSVHGFGGLEAARQMRPDAVLISPVFTTKSHPGTPALGAGRFNALARQSPCPVYALGGMTEARVKKLAASNMAGYAAIGGFTAD